MDAASDPTGREATSAGAGRAAAGEGVLGRLPRSRPGQRSDKRRGPTAPARASGERPGGPQTEPSPRERPRVPESTGGSPLGPIGGAAQLAERAAKLGLDVAGGVLRRLPRP